MSAYSIALFLHIVGALGFFAALGLEWITVMQLKRATTAEQVRNWLEASGSLGRVAMISMVVLLLAGIYMMATVWGGVAWLIVAFVAIVLMMVVMGRISTPRLKVIRQAVTTEKGALSPKLQEALRHPLLWIGIQARIIMGLGVVFLMTVKPDLVGSLLTVGITIIVSLVLALPMLNRNLVTTSRKTT
ncbi:MAG: hypothetical protein H0X30_21765 [Anaerolineae bacterium]|nr:hypothetical protein [Anaerolineae bacterium]